MNDLGAAVQIPVVKDDSNERPVPAVWRPVFTEIVTAIVERDYLLSRGITGVATVSPDTAQQIDAYLHEYGRTLVALPEESWNSSFCLWMGDFWDVLIDLWTEEEGPSDLVLSARVYESATGYEFHVYMVYVP